jgi:heme exporter protein C
MFLYAVMAGWAGIGLALNTRLSGDDGACDCPDRGDVRFPLALDRRAVGPPDLGHLLGVGRTADSELVLFFLYLGYMALHAAIDDPRRGDRASAVLALVGVINVPIIYFSVQWWNTLHQGASVSLTRSPSMAATMFTGMIVMAFAFWMYSIAAALARVRAIMLEREAHMQWTHELQETRG